MAPAATRRKVTPASKKGTIVDSVSQSNIQTFGKISKPQALSRGKTTLGKTHFEEGKNDSTAVTTNVAKKRKFESLEAAGGEQANSSATKKVKDRASNSDVHTSQKNSSGVIRKNKSALDKTPPQDVLETPTKGARTLLGDLALQQPPPEARESSSESKTSARRPLAPESKHEPNPNTNTVARLPEELQDLINLHSSFLTALSLHYAHNGSMTPADLRNIQPAVEQVWRKRKVSVDDIRRVLALEEGALRNGDHEPGPLSLADYGHGKICIEVADTASTQNAGKQPFSEAILNARFQQNLQQQWSDYNLNNVPNPNPADFISTLPMIPILPCSSLSKIPPLLSKGQRRLEDLKAGAIRAQQAPLRTTTGNAPPTSKPSTKQASTRSTDLFSRLAAKKLHQSTLPLPPSSEQVARQSALQRLPEIAPVIQSLANASQKHCDDDAAAEVAKARVTHASFTMPMLVQHLQMSLRNPVGKEEARRCVRLLAEVLPEWVGVMEVGRVVGVTVRGGGLGRDELLRRVGVLSCAM